MCGQRFWSAGPQFRRCTECVGQVKTWKNLGEDTAFEEFYLMENCDSGYSRTRNVFGKEEFTQDLETVYRRGNEWV